MSDIILTHDEALHKVQAAMQAGNPQIAIEVIQEYSKTHDLNAELLSKCGTAHMMMGKRAIAKKYYHQAVDADSNFSPAVGNLALAYAEEGQYLNAKKYAEKAHQLDLNNVPIYSTLALIYKHLGESDKAINILRQGLLVAPNHFDMMMNLAGLLVENDLSAEATELLQKIIDQNPSLARAHIMLSSLIKYHDGHDHLNQMKKLSTQPDLDLPSQIDIHFALSKAYEDLKDFGVSFDHYKKANDHYRSAYPYDIAQEKTFFEAIKNAVPNIKPLKSDDSITPIFIIGMPRSGTSLVEQILASHPQICGLGELSAIENLYKQSAANNFQNIQQARDAYLKTIEHRIGEHKIVTDKMPMNFRYIAFIKAIFPKAIFVHCERGAVDTCFSIYKRKFAGHIPYAQNLLEIAQYYKLYEGLMAHWKSLYPQEIYNVTYENLVGNTETEIKNLLVFCDVPWHQDCLEFYKNKRSVSTASTQQVRQPVYKDALAYWKNYEPYLGTLLHGLQNEED